MDSKKIKVGISSADILALVFGTLGVIFSAISIWLARNMVAVQAHGTGDVTVLPIVFGAIGVPFLMIGVITAALSVRKRAILKRVVSEGDYVMADVTDIRPNFSVQVNGHCPYMLECHYQEPTTGALHIFKSRNLSFYPAELKNRQVRVYVDRENLNHYYVDVDHLLPDVQLH